MAVFFHWPRDGGPVILAVMPIEPLTTAVKDEFFASSPPRVIPPEISQRVVPRGEMLTQYVLGAVLMLAGLLFCSFFMPRHLVRQWRLDYGTVEVVPGRILKAGATGTEVNENPVWEYVFTYSPPGMREVHGVAYTDGKTWAPGAAVDVRYLKADPETACPVGARMGVNPAWLVLTLAFPGLGLLIIFGYRRMRVWKLRLLRDGVISPAAVDEVRMGMLKGNNGHGYEIRLTCLPDGPKLRKMSYIPDEIDTAEAKRKAGEPLTVLHDPDQPKRFLIVDGWFDKAVHTPPERYLRENPKLATPVSVDPSAESETAVFLELPPPRRIPKTISKKVRCGGCLILPLIAGILALVLGGYLMRFWFPFHLIQQRRLDAGPSATVEGRVLEVKELGFKIKGERVDEIRYVYQPGGGEKTGTAYTVGDNWEPDKPLRVRHLISNPGVGVPEGARMGINSNGVFIALGFLVGGGLLVFSPRLIKPRDHKILRSGIVSSASIILAEKVSEGEHGDDTYKVHLSRAGDGIRLVKRTDDRREISFVMRNWQADEPVTILYLPDKPQRFLLPGCWNEEPRRRP